jgi:AcrR family transcriptional regulator
MAEASVTDDPTAPAREEPLDPRVLISRQRVLTTTLDLLTEAGLDELTIDEVSRRSGVAKTTNHRHWPNRSALAIDACLRMTDDEKAPPDTGSLEGDVRAILTHISELLATARWSSIVPSIVDAAEHDAAFADIHSRIQHRDATPLRSALERAAARGEFPSAADRDAIAAALLGPLFYRRWFSRKQIDAMFLEMIVGTLASLCRDTPNSPL